nr:PilZ domain-containing protein [uncultured Desulfobacter sp.]
MTTLSNLRISEALKSEMQKTREKTGLKQEDFISIMLARFKESQTEIDTASPIYKELTKVKRFFAQSERLVANFMESAANDKIHAEEKTLEVIDAARKKIAELEEQIQNLKGLNQGHENKISEQEEIISDFREKAKKLKALKDGWSEKETKLNTRITQLEAQAKASLDLKNEILEKETVAADHINKISELKQKLVLANQRSESDQALIKDLKNRVDTLQCDIASLEEKLTKAQTTLSAEKLACTKKNDKIQTANAEEYDLLTSVLSPLEEDVIDLESRRFKRKMVPLEIDVLVEGRLIKTNMKDISASGVLVKAKENIEKNKKAKMVFSIPGMEKPLKLKGRVVRSTKNGIAIEFDDKSQEFRSFLNHKIWPPEHN